jgi:hypothetical protein
LRWRSFRWLRLRALYLSPHYLSLRLLWRRLPYSLSLWLLLILALRTLRLDFLFSLLLLELLHLPARIFTATRCFSRKRGHLLLACGFSCRRNRLARSLI